MNTELSRILQPLKTDGPGPPKLAGHIFSDISHTASLQRLQCIYASAALEASPQNHCLLESMYFPKCLTWFNITVVAVCTGPPLIILCKCLC